MMNIQIDSNSQWKVTEVKPDTVRRIIRNMIYLEKRIGMIPMTDLIVSTEDWNEFGIYDADFAPMGMMIRK